MRAIAPRKKSVKALIAFQTFLHFSPILPPHRSSIIFLQSIFSCFTNFYSLIF
jgi:hypothetical protein